MADQKISGLPTDTSLDDNHYFLLNDPTGPTTKRTTLGTLRVYLQSVAAWITGGMIDYNSVLPKTVDANGWTKYNYGSHNVWRKRVQNASINIAASDRAGFTAINLPVGLSTIGSRSVQVSMSGSSYPGNFFIGVLAQSANSSITGLVGNNYPGGTLATGTFDIDVVISDL